MILKTTVLRSEFQQLDPDIASGWDYALVTLQGKGSIAKYLRSEDTGDFMVGVYRVLRPDVLLDVLMEMKDDCPSLSATVQIFGGDITKIL